MTTVQDLCTHLETVAPVSLAEEWDNVGLLVGDGDQAVQRVMTCLTLTPESSDEAIRTGADLVVTHHPLPFKPIRRITTDNTAGRMLWRLARAGVAVYSPHTAWDSARSGINQQLAVGLGLKNILPLCPIDDGGADGSGRYGSLSTGATLKKFIERVKDFLAVSHVQFVGEAEQRIETVAVACGSAGSFLPAACQAGCQLLLTGETSFHTCLEAKEQNIALVLPGHYASERFALEALATSLQSSHPSLEVWASRQETDPLRFA